MKIFGLAICFAIMLGAFVQIGPYLVVDLNSALFVIGGATGFLIMKNNPDEHIVNFGQGAVYFGWLGTLIGWDKPILKLGMYPFLYAELFKILILTIIVGKAFQLRKFI